jgi:TolA-binding protein
VNKNIVLSPESGRYDQETMVPLADFRLRALLSIGLLLVSFVGFSHGAESAAAAKSPAPQRTPQAKSPSAQAQATLDQAKRLIDSEQPEAAATILRKFLGASPSPDFLDDAYLLMAASMYGMKEYGEATRYLTQLFGEFPSSELIDRGKLLLAKTHA